MEKYNRIMEIFWLSMAVVLLIADIILIGRDGFDAWKWYLIFPVVAFLYYLLRRGMRKRMHKHQAWLKEQANKEEA